MSNISSVTIKSSIKIHIYQMRILNEKSYHHLFIFKKVLKTPHPVFQHYDPAFSCQLQSP